jgi:hypothetical protein
MNSPEIKNFIHENSNIFWYVPEDQKENLSLEAIVEAILNYGNRYSIKKLFDLVGIDKVFEIFGKQIHTERNNYFPPVKNYFQLYFKRHAQRDS